MIVFTFWKRGSTGCTEESVFLYRLLLVIYLALSLSLFLFPVPVSYDSVIQTLSVIPFANHSQIHLSFKIADKKKQDCNHRNTIVLG